MYILHLIYTLSCVTILQTIPPIMDVMDVLAMARNGNGKMAAFPIPERLRTHVPSGVHLLIMSPMQELALQTLKFTKEVGRL